MLWKNFNHLMNGPIKDLLYSMARTSREYDWSIESFKKEWSRVIDERPEVLEQYWLFHSMVRNLDTDSVSTIASRIRAVQVERQDTIMLDHYDWLMNQLTHAYGFHLVRCPDCATIVADYTTYRKESPFVSDIKCPMCQLEFHSSEAPDLFF